MVAVKKSVKSVKTAAAVEADVANAKLGKLTIVDGKFNIAEVIKRANAMKKSAKTLGSLTSADDLPPISTDPKDYVVMRPWFAKFIGILGLLKGRLTIVAGKSDTGKTSFCVEAIKAAQEQSWIVIYVETEGKTSRNRLRKEGIDTSQVFLVRQKFLERAWQCFFNAWDAIHAAYPGVPVLIVYDSLGTTVTERDAEIDITEQNQKPGEHGKINALAINKLIALLDSRPGHALICSTVYDNTGSVGTTFKGGQAAYLAASLAIETKPGGEIIKTVAGEPTKVGIYFRWKARKSHYFDAVEEGGTKPALWFNGQVTAKGIEEAPKKEKNEKDKKKK